MKFIPFIYPPLKALFRKQKRRQHFYSFKKAFISEAAKGIDIWRGYEDQTNIELRFTASDDYTLGYVDFLDLRRTKDVFDKTPLPLTVMVAGDGSFSKPFQINRQDPLVRSMNQYCDDIVVSFTGIKS